MPDVDGFDVLETLQSVNNTIPVVVTSDIQETAKARSFELGASEFANKPLFKHADQLNTLINRLLEKSV